MKKDILRSLLDNALISAIYVVLSIVLLPFSFNSPQIRLAEILVLLCFFRKDFVIGVTLGCFLSNTFSPLGAWDLLFGTLATLLSSLIIAYSKHLLLSAFAPVIINGLIVGGELYFILGLPFWINAALVAFGEFLAVVVFGYFLIHLLFKRSDFKRIIRVKQNEDFKW